MQFKFWEEPDDRIKILGQEYRLNLTFGNIMKVFELDNEKEEKRINNALFLLLGENLDLPIGKKIEVYNFIENEYLTMRSAPRFITDAWGNVIDVSDLENEKEERYYDLIFDSKEIYASFMQAYQIDLISKRDCLHWYKFNALLAALPSNTAFKQLIEIRSWKPQKGDSTEYKRKMRKLQQEVSLPIKLEGGENIG